MTELIVPSTAQVDAAAKMLLRPVPETELEKIMSPAEQREALWEGLDPMVQFKLREAGVEIATAVLNARDEHEED